jgi:hypothetical protein
LKFIWGIKKKAMTSLNKYLESNKIDIHQKYQLIKDLGKALHKYHVERAKAIGRLRPVDFVLEDGIWRVIKSVRPKDMKYPDHAEFVRYQPSEVFVICESRRTITTDIWSFGTIMCEILFERKPFAQYTDDDSIMFNIVSGKLLMDITMPKFDDPKDELVFQELIAVIKECTLFDLKDRKCKFLN